MNQAVKTNKKSTGLSAAEKAAMKERTKELKAQQEQANWETDVLAKIAEMPEHDRAMATRVHEIVKANAPDLSPKTWYGMPAYATKDGKIVCFFQTGHKFGYRYATLGFQDVSKLDDGEMWPIAYALTDMSAATEAKIIALVKKAVS